MLKPIQYFGTNINQFFKNAHSKPLFCWTAVRLHRGTQLHIAAAFPAHSLKQEITFPADRQPFFVQFFLRLNIYIQIFNIAVQGLKIFLLPRHIPCKTSSAQSQIFHILLHFIQFSLQCSHQPSRIFEIWHPVEYPVFYFVPF